MKKQSQKILSLVMAAMLLLSVGSVVSAADSGNIGSVAIRQTEINPRFIAIWDCGRALTLENSLGKLYCMGYTDTYSGYKGYVMVELQKMDGTWDTIKTWTHSSNTASATVDEYYYVGRGTYQLKVTHRAYNSNNVQVDEFIAYSDLLQY